MEKFQVTLTHSELIGNPLSKEKQLSSKILAEALWTIQRGETIKDIKIKQFPIVSSNTNYEVEFDCESLIDMIETAVKQTI